MNTFLLQSDVEEICQSLDSTAGAFSGKTVLLTGARGFLGRYLIETFRYLNQTRLKPACRVIALDNFITAGKLGSAEMTDNDGVVFREHDVIQPLARSAKNRAAWAIFSGVPRRPV